MSRIRCHVWNLSALCRQAAAQEKQAQDFYGTQYVMRRSGQIRRTTAKLTGKQREQFRAAMLKRSAALAKGEVAVVGGRPAFGKSGEVQP